MADTVFYFKHFSIRQDHSLMKITTDSILLGAWTGCKGTGNILDVGAGTGVITLMIAQRCKGRIMAIEPDPGSYRDLLLNVGSSPWHEKIMCRPDTFQQFVRTVKKEEKPVFDLIVSNPPFFINDKLPADKEKANARHGISLSYKDLIAGTCKILAPEGIFCIIIPCRYMSHFISVATDHKLYCNRILYIKTRKNKEHTRVLLEFAKRKKPLDTHTLVIHDSNGYTDDFRTMTREYYLFM